MTSLLGRLLPLFTGPRRTEDLFTEAVARLFERRPELCLSWLDELELITPVSGEDRRYVRVTTQKPFVALDEHDSGSRPDLILEVRYAVEDAGLENSIEVVMIESKIGSAEGEDQLRRYAAHLGDMAGTRKTLVYITRAYDPKDSEEIRAGTQDVDFRQLRWHDFYKFLQTIEKDALVEEVMLFMEEQGMARSHRLTISDLASVSGVLRAFEIFDETLGGEVQAELETFAGNKISRRETFGLNQIRNHRRYIVLAPLHMWDLYCYAGYEMRAPDGYPTVKVYLEAPPRTVGRDVSVAAMRQIALRNDWSGQRLNEPTRWATVVRGQSLANFISEEDHVAAIKRFFIESIQQLREELTEFKKENPDLPWNGE